MPREKTKEQNAPWRKANNSQVNIHLLYILLATPFISQWWSRV